MARISTIASRNLHQAFRSRSERLGHSVVEGSESVSVRVGK
jgi:hypothetical protein